MGEESDEQTAIANPTGETAGVRRTILTHTESVSLTTWTLATVDTVLFVLLGVIAAHASGALADLLSGLNTLVGIAVFCYLWALTVLAVRWVNSRVSLTGSPTGTLVLHGLVAGSATGIGFLLGPLTILVGLSVSSGPFRPQSVLLVTLIGAGFAAVVGAVVGLIAGLLDIALYRLAGALLPDPQQ